MDLEDFKILGKFFLILVAILGVVSLGVFKLLAYDCSKLSENTGWETKFKIWGGGCLVKQDGRWIPYDVIREINN